MVEAGYEKLKVYERAFLAAIEIHKISLSLPKIEQFALADQMRRSSKGICANIAEGHAKNHLSNKEFGRFLSIAAGSSEETRVWIKFCKELAYIDTACYERLNKEYDEISKMINGLIRSLK